MNNTNINYPYPVLTNVSNDYVDCHFKLAIDGEVLIEGDSIIIEVSYDLSSPGLKNMIQNGQAKVVLYLESVESEFRAIYDFDKDTNTYTVVVNKNNLNNFILLRGFIVSLEDNSSFVLPEHNGEYFVAGPPRIKKGNILAIADESYKIPIEVYDPLADRKSIFTIRRQVEQQEDIRIDFYSFEKITIFLNNELMDKYQQLYSAPENRTFLSTTFALPVLVDALYIMKNNQNDLDDDIASKKWYQVINNRLIEENINLENSENMTEVANRILSHVLKYTLDSYGVVFEALNGGDE